EPLVTPRLISVQGFALPFNQPLEAPTHINETYVHHNNKKIRTSWILYQESRFIVRIFFPLKYFCLSLLIS
ncbi:hypothetical protein P4593_08195, partial [Priestia megaterium]|uniref:hypothetical protein n=1 Tax=Priestia megaterium TaxID=1404 RepID=UPI0030C9869F